jgi:hypothetical protein
MMLLNFSLQTHTTVFEDALFCIIAHGGLEKLLKWRANWNKKVGGLWLAKLSRFK